MGPRSMLHGIDPMLVIKSIGPTKQVRRVHGAESVTRIQKIILRGKLAWFEQGMRTEINPGPEEHR